MRVKRLRMAATKNLIDHLRGQKSLDKAPYSHSFPFLRSESKYGDILLKFHLDDLYNYYFTYL